MKDGTLKGNVLKNMIGTMQGQCKEALESCASMLEFRFTLEVVRRDRSDSDFAEWIASESGAVGHMSRKGRDYIHFVAQANSLEEAVDDAVDILKKWQGLEVIGFRAACSNTGILARA